MGVVTHGGQIVANQALLDHLDEVVLSFDSLDAETNDRQRAPKSLERVMTAMDHALANGCRVYVNMVVTKATLGGLEDMLTFCEGRGVGFHAQPLYFGWKYSSTTEKHLALTDAEIREMHHRLARWKREGRKVMFAAETYLGVAKWTDHAEFTRKSPGLSRCMAGRDYIHIEPNGDVYPCGHQGADFEPLNLVTHGFVDAVAHTRRHNCGDCWIAYLNERKALFGLRPHALRAFLRRG